jgi:hypothetical protein|tara:strand:+ start:430 stop:651 length:222 start_codon:yes stop_codon:yes gene_type:complete
MQSAAGTEAVCLSTNVFRKGSHSICQWESVVQDGSAPVLQKNIKECESISAAFAIVAEQGPKALKRYLGIMGE